MGMEEGMAMDMGDTATQDMDMDMDMAMDMDTVMDTVCIPLPYWSFRFIKKIRGDTLNKKLVALSHT